MDARDLTPIKPLGLFWTYKPPGANLTIAAPFVVWGGQDRMETLPRGVSGVFASFP